MEKLQSLTTEQEQLMFQVRDKWLDYIFSCKNSIDKEKSKVQIEWLYDFCKLDKPAIIYVDSPMSCQLAVAYLKEYIKEIKKHGVDHPELNSVGNSVRNSVENSVRNSVENSVWNSVWNSVENSVGNSVRNSVGNSVRNSVGNSVRNSVRNSVGNSVRNSVRNSVGNSVENSVGNSVENSVWNSVGNSVWNSVGNSVRNSVWNSVGNSVGGYETPSWYGNIGDYGWVSFYDFFTQIGIINNHDFNEFKSLLESGIYDMIQLNGFCIVSDLPCEIKRRNDVLHCIDSPAITFKDGYCQYYINGRNIPFEHFSKIRENKFTTEDFFKENNEEVKSACIAMLQELYGEEFVFNFFRKDLKEVDTYVDKKDAKYLEGTTKGMNVGVYTLFKGEINNMEVAYVRCYCPSTDRMFFLGVDDIHNTAKDAIASLYRIPSKLKSHIKSISRQGERYSTVLTDKGNEILKGMSEEEIADVTHVTGDFYFSRIKYEF